MDTDNDRGNGEQYFIRSVLRAADLLLLFAESSSELSRVEISRRLGLPISTTFRLLVTLTERNLIEQNPHTGNFRPGVGCLALGNAFLAHNDLRQRALKPLERLRDETGETIHLGILDGAHVVYLDKLAGLHPIGLMSSRVGMQAPAYCTGLGKAILAFLPSEQSAKLLVDGSLTAFTENTITNLEELKTHFAQIRAYGYAFDNQEHERGVACIAAPVFNHQGVAAAISVAGPAERIAKMDDRTRLCKLVQRTAQEISTLLGSGLNASRDVS